MHLAPTTERSTLAVDIVLAWRTCESVCSRSDSLSFAQNESDHERINRDQVLTSCFDLRCSLDLLHGEAGTRGSRNFAPLVVEHEWKPSLLFNVDSVGAD
jgi:hypothetical protein